mmetsp:Transcript_69322/g.184008  ORF Transcript_69322/g.184008 Transcript_69322/m.184008 type:complete len:222 (+) Transcript_69322:649-1314(+)
MRVELVTHRVRRLGPLAVLQEGGEGLPGLLGDEPPCLQRRQLRHGGLREVVGLRLQHLDGPLQRGDRLRVVLMQLVVGCFLDVADLCGCLVIALPRGDVTLEQLGLLLQARRLGLVLLDVCLQGGDLLLGLLDVARGLDLGVLAELAEGGVVHLLGLLVFLALGEHPLQQLDHLLHWRWALRARPRRQRHGGQEQRAGHLRCSGGLCLHGGCSGCACHFRA